MKSCGGSHPLPAMKTFNQIEAKLAAWMRTSGGESWRQVRRSHKWDKQKKHRIERHRARIEPECAPLYRKYHGWEY